MKAVLLSLLLFCSAAYAGAPTEAKKSSEKTMLIYCEPQIKDGSGIAWGENTSGVRIINGKIFATVSRTDIKTGQQIDVTEEFETQGRDCSITQVGSPK